MLSWWRGTLFGHVRTYLSPPSPPRRSSRRPRSRPRRPRPTLPAPSSRNTTRSATSRRPSSTATAAASSARRPLERGTVQVKKPSRMRWTYESPERKVFVADGARIYSYIPEDKQVIVAPCRRKPRRRRPALFLSGHGSLRAGFRGVVRARGRIRAGHVLPEARPAPPGGRVRLLTLVVDRGTLPPAQAHHRRRAGRAIDVHLFGHPGEYGDPGQRVPVYHPAGASMWSPMNNLAGRSRRRAWAGLWCALAAARRRRRALGAAPRPGARSRRGARPSASRTRTGRSSSTRPRGRNPQDQDDAPGARARQAARLAGPLRQRPPLRVGRQARRGARRVPARRRAQPGEHRDRRRAAEPARRSCAPRSR